MTNTFAANLVRTGEGDWNYAFALGWLHQELKSFFGPHGSREQLKRSYDEVFATHNAVVAAWQSGQNVPQLLRQLAAEDTAAARDDSRAGSGTGGATLAL